MKNKNTAWLLWVFLWGIWLHHFYLGKPWVGVLYIVLFFTWITIIVWFIEWLQYFSMSKEKFDKKYNAKDDNDENEELRNKVERLRLQKEYEKLSRPERPTGFIDKNKE